MAGMKDLFGDELYEQRRQPTFGTEARKLYRPDDPETSKDAAEAVDTTKLEAMVYEAICSFGAGGCISDQVRGMFPGKSYSSITARYKALDEKGLIVRGPDKRAGLSKRDQMVMRKRVAP